MPGTMDGERGNNEPGMVGGGGFRNASLWGTREGCLVDPGVGIRHTAREHHGPDSPSSFCVGGTPGFSVRGSRLFGLLPR